MAQIELQNVSVEFCIHNSSSRSLQLKLFSSVGGTLKDFKKAVFVRALHNLNLKIEDGERIGLIGHNGAGKTTLLRVLSGVYEPIQGTISVKGRISSFTNINLGMDPEATGYENIIFRCIFLGLTFAEARKLSPSIAEFSELGDYLNVPVRTYSSGMFLRLAFAISTAVEPDILIMDEMIGTGDARFLEKAQNRLNELLKRVKILVLATHNPEIMRNLCDRVIWLDHGQIRKVGSFEKIYPEYIAANSV